MLLRLSVLALMATILIACSDASVSTALPATQPAVAPSVTPAASANPPGTPATGASTPAPVAAGTPQPATPRGPIIQAAAAQAAWREDLRYLAEQLRTKHPRPFYRTPEAEFQSVVDALDRDIPSLTREQILTGFIHLSALIDGHTNLSLFQPALGFHLYALRIYDFSDGLYVIAAPDAYREAVGARIVRIGSMDAAQAWQLLAPLAQHDSAQYTQLIAPLFHLVPEILHALGIVDDVARPEFVLEKPDGTRITLNPAAQTIGEYQQWTNAVFYGLPKLPQPLTLSRRDEAFWFTYLRDTRTLYIEYNQVRAGTQGGDGITTFSQKIADFVRDNDVQRTVVDMRHNGGGDNTTYSPFLNLLRTNPAINRRGRLFVIIGRQTFSAATNFVTDLERSSSVIFAGEPTGGSPNLYGDTRPYTLPNSKLTVQISAIYWQKSTPDDKRPAIAPQLSAPLSSKDYFAGRDPALQAVLAYTPPLSQTVVFATDDGVKLGGTIYGGGTRAVIFSNIGNGTQPDWQDVPALLAQRGYLALTYDWRGFGASQGTQAYTLADKDLRAAITYLRTQGAKQIVLIGGSLGGMASLLNADIAELAGIVVIGSPREAPNFKVSDQQITAIRAPKLFVGSQNDRTVAYSETLAMYQLAVEPKTLQTYAGDAHGSDLLKSSDRAAFVKLLLEFAGTALGQP